MGTSRVQIFLQPFPPTNALREVSAGRSPIWSSDGRLFYSSFNDLDAAPQIASVEIQTQPSLVVGKTTRLPINGFVSSAVAGSFDMTPDGKQFLVMLTRFAETATNPANEIKFTLNWFEELKQHVPCISKF